MIFILIVARLSYYTDEGSLKDVEHKIKLDDPRHLEERFFFGLCPISLKTSYSEDGTSDTSNELKVRIKLLRSLTINLLLSSKAIDRSHFGWLIRFAHDLLYLNPPLCKYFLYFKACSGCLSVCYAGKEEQKKDWNRHKAVCKSLQHIGNGLKLFFSWTFKNKVFFTMS